MITKSLSLIKIALLAIFIKGCAYNTPLEVANFSNIVQLSEEMAKAYTPGAMKALTYAGTNTSSSENQDYRLSYFKVKGDHREFSLIEKTYELYCVNKGGEFASKRSARVASLNVMSCVGTNGIPIFNTLISSSAYNGSRSLKCHSVLAVENKNMKTDEFADKVLMLDEAKVKSNFYSSAGC